jgi:hypothetical protein
MSRARKLTPAQSRIAIEDVPDPNAPNRTIRRARVVDPLIGICGRSDDGRARIAAAEWYRTEAAIAAGARDHQAPLVLVGYSARSYGPADRQLDAMAAVGRARRAIGAHRLYVVESVVLGWMSLSAVETERRMRHGSAREPLIAGLDALASVANNVVDSRG